MPENTVTVTGNLTRDPELRFTPAGAPVASMGIAVANRKKDKDGNWGDGPGQFFEVTVWRDLATNVSESLEKGNRVIVTGRLEFSQWEKDGEKRNKVQIVADEVGPSLRWATCDVQRTERTTPIDVDKAVRNVTEAFDADSAPF